MTLLVGLASLWPAAATAEVPALPVIGFLGPQSPAEELLASFHRGLNELGLFEGRNVSIEYQWVLNQKRGLPDLAAELVRRRVALIVCTDGLVSAKAAREATTTIPIIFVGVGLDPVENGFVASFNRPGGNVTGLSLLNAGLLSKRLDLLQQMVPPASRTAYLMNDDSAGLGPNEVKQQETERQIADKLGLVIHYARNAGAIESAFAEMARQPPDALLVGSDPVFSRQRAQIVALAARYMLPASYSRREFADSGGLMSYGPSRIESWRQVGRYAGRILKGARPGDLPVRLEDKYELVINMKTAKALGLAVPPLLHGLADDVIE
jgi:putative tryptophan/tyrosine transport system substrate-binding protein